MTAFVDLAAAEAWIRTAVDLTGPIELERERAWATVYRAPTSEGLAWFKACQPVQAFEPALTAALAARWPDRVSRVLAHDPVRAWLLTADAGDQVATHGNAPEIWLRALPLYAELQRGEVEHVPEHLDAGVPAMPPEGLPERFEQLLREDLPLEAPEMDRFRAFGPRFAELCQALGRVSEIVSIQHDDLHLRSLFVDGPNLRVIDWGDASIAHPFASLVVTFRFLEDANGLAPDDPWFSRLRDAYLEPWGSGLTETFELAMRVGMVAQMASWQRHRSAMAAAYAGSFDVYFAERLRRVLARAVDPGF
jgi:phosphotransferase family enzyme